MCLQPNVCRREKVIWEFSEFRTQAALKTRNNFSRWERERIKRPFFNRHRWNGILQFFMDFMLFGFAISTVLFYLLHSAICICVCTLASRTCFVLPNRLPHFIMLVLSQILSHTIHTIHKCMSWTHAHTSSAMQWNQYKPSEWTFERANCSSIFREGECQPKRNAEESRAQEWVL